MKTSNVSQRSIEWFNMRRGLPTASRFDSILTAKTGAPSAAQNTLINELLAESIEPPDQGLIKPRFLSEDMEQGMILEAEARCAFELEFAPKGEKVKEVGFVLHDSGLFGASPDALIGDVSGLELKAPQLATHISYVRAGVLPDKYKCQVHGSMIVTGRDSWSFMSYARNARPFHLIVHRDEFTAKLHAELLAFAKKYNEARALFDLPPIGTPQQ